MGSLGMTKRKGRSVRLISIPLQRAGVERLQTGKSRSGNERQTHKNINLLNLESSHLELLDDPVKRDGRVGSGEDVPEKQSETTNEDRGQRLFF